MSGAYSMHDRTYKYIQNFRRKTLQEDTTTWYTWVRNGLMWLR